MAMSRSENMRRIRSKNTVPELQLRAILRSLGYPGYRLHRQDIPGRPDVAFIGRKKAIFVHGCFWHGHTCPEGSRIPKSNQEYWIPKIQRNRERDAEHMRELAALGWTVLTVWECEFRDTGTLTKRVIAFMCDDLKTETDPPNGCPR